MTATGIARRPGVGSILMIVTSISASVAIALAVDSVLILLSTDLSPLILTGALIFNATVIAQSLVGGIIEWRRPGHAIGRLMMVAGPLYGVVSAGWTTAGTLEPLVDPAAYLVFGWTGGLVSWPAVALIAGWIPVLFPTGTLPGPRWRPPAVLLVALTSIGLVALAFRPGPMYGRVDYVNPFGMVWWPGFLQPLADAVPFAVLGTLVLAVAAVITRYRRGDRIERLQIRWFVAAVAIVPLSLLAIPLELAIRNGGVVGGPVPDAPNALVSVQVPYVGILAMPIAIGIALTRHGLYEIDRLISRTIGWAVVTGVLVLVFAGTVVGLQAILARVTEGETLAVAASTLVAFALFQPVRRGVQTVVDRRFDRARYDGDQTAAAFTERLRDRMDLAGLEADITGVVDTSLRPTRVGIWIRRSGRGETA
jgi:hypothetical protein